MNTDFTLRFYRCRECNSFFSERRISTLGHICDNCGSYSLVLIPMVVNNAFPLVRLIEDNPSTLTEEERMEAIEEYVAGVRSRIEAAIARNDCGPCLVRWEQIFLNVLVGEYFPSSDRRIEIKLLDNRGKYLVEFAFIDFDD